MLLRELRTNSLSKLNNMTIPKVSANSQLVTFTTFPSTWIAGKVVKVTGPLSYYVELPSEHIIQRHVDAIHLRTVAPEPTKDVTPTSDQDEYCDDDFLPDLSLPPPVPHPHPVHTPSTVLDFVTHLIDLAGRNDWVMV